MYIQEDEEEILMLRFHLIDDIPTYYDGIAITDDHMDIGDGQGNFKSTTEASSVPK